MTLKETVIKNYKESRDALLWVLLGWFFVTTPMTIYGFRNRDAKFQEYKEGIDKVFKEWQEAEKHWMRETLYQASEADRMRREVKRLKKIIEDSQKPFA